MTHPHTDLLDQLAGKGGALETWRPSVGSFLNIAAKGNHGESSNPSLGASAAAGRVGPLTRAVAECRAAAGDAQGFRAYGYYDYCYSFYCGGVDLLESSRHTAWRRPPAWERDLQRRRWTARVISPPSHHLLMDIIGYYWIAKVKLGFYRSKNLQFGCSQPDWTNQCPVSTMSTTSITTAGSTTGSR